MAAATSNDNTDNSAWNCTMCTYENQTDSTLCEMCGTQKPGSKGDDNGWKCVLCTFVNPKTISACAVCGAPSPLTNDLSGKQICGSCTTINFANAHNCSVCGQPLSHKIIQLDDDGQFQQTDIDPNSNNNNNDQQSQLHGINDDTDFNAIKPFVGDNNNNINNNSNNLPQFANPLGGGYGNNGYQHNNNYYQPQQQQQQQQQQYNNNGDVMFSGMGGWFGGGNDINNVNHYHSSKTKHNKHKKHKSKRRSNKNEYNNNQNENDDDDESVEFMDVTEIFKKDANDQERIKKEEEEVKVLSEWYSHIYLTKKDKYDIDKITNIMNKMIKLIPKEHWDEVNKNKKDKKDKKDNNNDEEKQDMNACQVCYCEFDDDEGKLIIMEQYCDDAIICKGCFIQHLKIKIKDDDITPWILCPAPNCKAPICCNLLLIHLDINDLYKFCVGFIRKHLARNNNWIRCQTKQCKFGWMILDKNTTKQHKVKCKSCNKRQTVCKDPIKSDKGFNDLIKNGVLRLCPKCSLPTMKDKGMCNIMHCGKCGIYWNWKTREIGTSSSQLKNKARNNGTLWEPGELAYQQQLQRTDLTEFKKLLQRNGIKYDPNYVRGTR